MSAAGVPEHPLILIADDDPMNRAIAGAALKTAGFDVAEVADGMQALMEVQRLHPALLLLDIVMPNMDGLMVLGALRQRLSGRSVPVIVLTSKDDTETERRCIEQGAEDYIVKPINPGTLVARVQAVLRRVAAAR